MIKEFLAEEDLDQVMSIWLTSNIEGHSFIPAAYWESHYDEVAKLLPQSDLLVYHSLNDIAGFIGIMEGYIAGIFVKAEYRSQGIGKALLEEAKKRYRTLTLSVYGKNKKARNFYLREGFVEVNSEVGEPLDEIEYHMQWKRI